MKKNDNKERT